MSRYSQAVDPGGQHTGIVLVEHTRWGIMPVDGVTLDRTDEERDTLHTGGPSWARRVYSACVALLDKHDVADDDVDVYVETLLPPKPYGGSHVSMAIWCNLFGAHDVLGGVSTAWPDATLVPPANHDHAIGGYPNALKGRTPNGWMHGGSARQHQRAAWGVMMAGRRQRGLDTNVVPDEVIAAVAAMRAAGARQPSIGALVAAVRRAVDPAATPRQVADWALTAAQILKPGTPDSLRDRLLAQASSEAAA